MKNKQEKFSIRKFNNGVASVLVATMIGATPIISAVTSVSANEVNNTIKTEYTITIIRTLNGQRQIPEEIKLPHGTNLNEEIPKRYSNAQYSRFTSPDIQDLSKPLDKDGTIIVEYDVIEAESSTHQARVEYVLENSSSNTPPFKRKTLVDSGRIFDTISTTYNINIYDPTNGKYFVNENEITKPYSTVSDRKESTIKVDISEGKLRPEILEEKGKTYQFVKIQEGSSEVYEFSNNKSGTRKTVYVYREIDPSTIKPNTDTDNAQPLTLTVTHRYDFGELIETKTDIEPGTVLPIKAWGNDWDGKNTQNDRVPDRRNYIRSPYINMTVNGEKVKTGSEITINENTNVVIQYGDTPMIEVLRQSIPFKTIYKEDITLENGKTVVEREGQEGVSEDYGGSINIREQAVDKIVRIGTKPTVKTEVIPFETVYENDPTLPEGTEKVKQNGVEGSKTVTTTYTLNPETGEITENQPTVEVKEPVNKIILKGTGKNAEIPFGTEIIEDPNLDMGKEIVEAEGVVGIKDVTGKVLKEPVKKVIRKGTKKVEVVPFDTVYENDPTLDEGVEKIVQEGKNGERVNGKVTIEPIKQIIKVGTKKQTVTEIIPFETIYENDPTLPEGTEKVKTPGVDGIKENGKIIKEPVNKVILKGTKKVSVLDPIAPNTTEVIPFDTVYEKDETLDKGVEKVVQEGKNGERVNGKVTKEPVKKIIKIGTKEKTTQVASSPKQETSNNKEEKKSEPAKETPNTNSGTSSIIGLISSLIGLGTFYKKKND